MSNPRDEVASFTTTHSRLVLLQPPEGGAVWVKTRRRASLAQWQQQVVIAGLLGAANVRYLPEQQSFELDGPKSVQFSAWLNGSKPQPPDRLLSQALGLLDTLAAWHQRGLALLCFSPQNLLYSAENQLFTVVEWHLALPLREAGELASGGRFSEETLAYASPEQTGKTTLPLDYRSDFFSFGVLLYQLATGRLPFEGDDAANTIFKILTQSPPAPLVLNPVLPAGLSAVIEKLLAKNPDDRYQSVSGLRHDLEFLAAQKPHTGAFVPGRADGQQEFGLHPVFVGRSGVSQPIGALLRGVIRASGKGLVAVRGPFGSGKTALLDRIEGLFYGETYLLRSNLTNDQALPYAGLRAGLEALAQSLMSLPPAELDNLRFGLESQVGEVLPVLIDFCPALAQLLDSQPTKTLQALSGPATQLRLAYALAGLFKALLNTGKPVLWLLDNAHEASEATLRLLDSLLREATLGPFSVLMAGTAGGETDRMGQLLRETGDLKEIQTATLSLDDLSPAEVEAWLRALHLQPATVPETAGLIRQKTGGNPFFIRQLLEKVRQQNLARRVPGEPYFRFDTLALAAFETTDNLLDFTTEKIKNLPPDVRHLFDLLACFRQQFSPTDVAALAQHDVGLTDQRLGVLVESGILIRSVETQVLAFANPQLAEIGLNLLDPALRARAFAQVAAYVQAHTDLANADALFELASKVLEIPPEAGRAFTENLLKAARKAAEIGAYELALRGYAYAARQLTEADWEADFETCFALYGEYLNAATYSAQAEAEFERVLLFLTQKVRTEGHLARITVLHAAWLEYRQQLAEAIGVTLPVLRQMGVRLEETPALPRILWYLYRAEHLTRQGAVRRMEQLPENTDPRLLHIASLLRVIASAAFLTRPKMLPEVAYLLLQYSVKYGLTAVSGAGFMGIAFQKSSFHGKYQQADEMMELSIRLDQRFKVMSLELAADFLKGLFVTSWLAPLSEATEQLHATYRKARENGVLTIGFYALGTASVYELYGNGPLEAVQQRSLESLQLAEARQQSLVVSYCRIVAQAAHELRQAGPESPLFNGPFAFFDREQADFEASQGITNVNLLRAISLKIKVLLKRFGPEEVQLFGQFLADSRQTGEGAYTNVVGCFYGGLACLTQPGPFTRTQKRLAQQAIARLKRFSQTYEGNNGAKYHLLGGLYALRTGQAERGMNRLDMALELATRYNILSDEALIHEAKGQQHAQAGQEFLAKKHLREAADRYATWGAGAVVARLRAEYAFLASADAPGSTPDGATPGDTGSRVDILSFLKASNSIVGSLRLDSLLETLLDVLLENAGAQRAALLLHQGGALRMHARKADQNPVQLQTLPLAEADLPQNFIRYVLRTAKPLALTEAHTDRLFAADAYFQRNKTRSALAMPVVKNRQVVAVMYLENNATPGVFNQQRLETLGLLSGQVAISLENALLYDQLEARVRERTEQLQAEMDKSEGLLLNILPQNVAQELKQTGRATARRFDDVTVLFTDFVNFTRISELMGPDELVAELDYCFQHFDAIVTRHGLEKIKTIGDAYLCVGGLDEQSPNHTADTVRAALEIRQFIADRKAQREAEGGHFFDIRLGLHNGPLVAGVVGTRKFAYDIWGDTVNTAARMEQSSEPGRVNVSGKTWAVVSGQFVGTHRGQVRAKNKGEIEMYFVEKER